MDFSVIDCTHFWILWIEKSYPEIDSQFQMLDQNFFDCQKVVNKN